MQFVVELRNRRASAYYQRVDENTVHFENSIVSKKLYIKLLRIQAAILAGNLLSMCNALLIFDSRVVPDITSPLGSEFIFAFDLHDVLLLFQSLLSFFVLVCVFIHERLRWQNDVKRGLAAGSFLGTLLSNWKLIFPNVLFELLHPNYLLAHVALWNPGNTVGFDTAPNNSTITYHANDLCCALAVTRGVMIFILIIYRLDYNSDTSFRIWWGD